MFIFSHIDNKMISIYTGEKLDKNGSISLYNRSFSSNGGYSKKTLLKVVKLATKIKPKYFLEDTNNNLFKLYDKPNELISEVYGPATRNNPLFPKYSKGKNKNTPKSNKDISDSLTRKFNIYNKLNINGFKINKDLTDDNKRNIARQKLLNILND